MANTPKLPFLASDWLISDRSQTVYKSTSLIGRALALIIITGSEEEGNERSNGRSSPV